MTVKIVMLCVLATTAFAVELELLANERHLGENPESGKANKEQPLPGVEPGTSQIETQHSSVEIRSAPLRVSSAGDGERQVVPHGPAGTGVNPGEAQQPPEAAEAAPVEAVPAQEGQWSTEEVTNVQQADGQRVEGSDGHHAGENLQ
jgi:hypothetical protein